MSNTADEILAEMAKTYKDRNAVYGSNYLNVGPVMDGLFPNGVRLSTPEEFIRWHLFELIVVKMTRFAVSGLTHLDSIHDIAVYAAMLETLMPEAQRIADAQPTTVDWTGEAQPDPLAEHVKQEDWLHCLHGRQHDLIDCTLASDTHKQLYCYTCKHYFPPRETGDERREGQDH